MSNLQASNGDSATTVIRPRNQNSLTSLRLMFAPTIVETYGNTPSCWLVLHGKCKTHLVLLDLV